MYFLFVFFYVLFVCKCVLLPLGVNPIAVKYIVSYHTHNLVSFHSTTALLWRLKVAGQQQQQHILNSSCKVPYGFSRF